MISGVGISSMKWATYEPTFLQTICLTSGHIIPFIAPSFPRYFNQMESPFSLSEHTLVLFPSSKTFLPISTSTFSRRSLDQSVHISSNSPLSKNKYYNGNFFWHSSFPISQIKLVVTEGLETYTGHQMYEIKHMRRCHNDFLNNCEQDSMLPWDSWYPRELLGVRKIKENVESYTPN